MQYIVLQRHAPCGYDFVHYQGLDGALCIEDKNCSSVDCPLSDIRLLFVKMAMVFLLAVVGPPMLSKTGVLSGKKKIDVWAACSNTVSAPAITVLDTLQHLHGDRSDRSLTIGSRVGDHSSQPLSHITAL